jgi:hypothetical protein
MLRRLSPDITPIPHAQFLPSHEGLRMVLDAERQEVLGAMGATWGMVGGIACRL